MQDNIFITMRDKVSALDSVKQLNEDCSLGPELDKLQTDTEAAAVKYLEDKGFPNWFLIWWEHQGNTILTLAQTVRQQLDDGMQPEDVLAIVDVVKSGLSKLEQPAPAQTEATPEDTFLSCFKPLSDFAEEEARWLVPDWIPEGQITLLAADGGVGKTSLWVNIVAAISAGKPCVLDPPDMVRKPQRVAFLTTEDSIRKKLKRKLREAGADANNIITFDAVSDKDGFLRKFKFGSAEMAQFIRHFRPALCIFDPLQGFVPALVNMGSRNAMRDCLAPLIALGEETGTTFVVICHTNKRKAAYGRDRISDSADLWDISRSVLMAGYTEDEGIRYLSNEKNNYTQLQKTVLFSIDSNGQIVREGTSHKRDREYQQEAAVSVSAPKREDCKTLLLRELDNAGGMMPSKLLEDAAKANGFSYRTLRRAKDELKQAGAIKYTQHGGAWHVHMVTQGLPDDVPTL